MVSGITSCQCSGCGFLKSTFTKRPLGALILVSKKSVVPWLFTNPVAPSKLLVIVTKEDLGLDKSFTNSLLPEVALATEMNRYFPSLDTVPDT